MAASYNFAIVRLSPVDSRDERINIGVVVFNAETLDVRMPKRLDKVRAISAALDIDILTELVRGLEKQDERNVGGSNVSVEIRHQMLRNSGPLSLSELGSFEAVNATAYEERLDTILKAMVDAEPAPIKPREKRSKLLTQVKRVFRQQRVLAKKDDDLTSHRILPSFTLDEGLVADLVLKNGALHVVETVDASGDSDTVKRAISDIAVAALVFERARMKYPKTNAKLVYEASSQLERVTRPSLDVAEKQGTQLVNWASADQRGKFVQELSLLATPLEDKRKMGRVAMGELPELGMSKLWVSDVKVFRGRKLNLDRTKQLPKPKKK